VKLRYRLRCALAGIAIFLIGRLVAGAPLLYFVTSTGDAPLVGSSNFCDSDPATPGEQCTLRSAIEAANLHPGVDGIEFSIPSSDPNYDPAAGRHTIKLNSALPAITEGVQLFGSGASKLTVRRDSSTEFRIFQITASGTVTLSGLTITNGGSAKGGGVQNLNAGTLRIIDCLVTANFAGGGGGGIQNNGTGIVELTNSTVSGNGSDFVGGILNESSGTVNIVNSFVTVNKSNRFGGGGIYNQSTGTVNVNDSLIANNESGSRGGGGISASGAGTVNLNRCTVSYNSDGESGGGVYVGTGTVNIDASTISGNTAKGGGGIFNLSGSVTITNSTVSQNASTTDTANGGGLRNEGTAVISNSTFAGNTAHADGAGISNAGTLFMANCTITGNSSSVTRQLFADLGQGIANSSSGFVQIKSSIVALNTGIASSPDVSGSFGSGGYNFIGKAGSSAIFNASTDQKGTLAAPLDPQIDPNGLQDNGGPTQTVALLFGSPAIDGGLSPGLNPPNDQRGAGFPRIFDDPARTNAADGDGSDIGAFEVQTAPGFVANVSTRLPVGTGDNVLIEGFIVLGPSGSTKNIIVRAIGPSLIPFGIPDALANPILEIHDSNNAIVATNDDWRTTQVGGIITGDQSQAISGSGVAPGNNLESAIIANLAPGSYTAVVRGVNNGVGTGVVDAYDLSAGSPARLANIATRGLIQPGDKLMIAGFIIQNGPVRAVVRAIGPSLSAFGITNALPDTTLQLKDQNGTTVLENDDWQSSQKQELENTGLQPSHDLEAAVVGTITPGQYTVQVRGKPESTGIGVVQVYFLQ
jgi:hypothetical protein